LVIVIIHLAGTKIPTYATVYEYSACIPCSRHDNNHDSLNLHTWCCNLARCVAITQVIHRCWPTYWLSCRNWGTWVQNTPLTWTGSAWIGPSSDCHRCSRRSLTFPSVRRICSERWVSTHILSPHEEG